MLAAAETTHSKGFGHFAIVGSADDSRETAVYSSYGYGTFGYGWGNAYGTGTATTIEKPKTVLTNEMFPGGKPADAPPTCSTRPTSSTRSDRRSTPARVLKPEGPWQRTAT